MLNALSKRSIPQLPRQMGFSAQRPSVLLNADIDHSLIIWNHLHTHDYDQDHLSQASQILNKLPADQAHLMATTSRSPSLVRLVSHLLAAMPFKHIGTNNGQQLFLPDRSPSGALTLVKLDPKYQQLLAKQRHWSPSQFEKALKEALKASGFRKINRQELDFTHLPCWQVDMEAYELGKDAQRSHVITVIKDQTAAYLWSVKEGRLEQHVDELDKALIQNLAKTISQALQKKQIKHHYVLPEFPDCLMIDFSPEGVDKRFITDYMVKTFPLPPQAVITIDDNHNGKTMLEAAEYTWTDGQRIPNYPIIVGNKLTDLDAHPRKLRTQRGALGQAILQQFISAASTQV